MTDVKRGLTFTHTYILDPTYLPNIEAGETYANGPRAKMRVTSVQRGKVYYTYADADTDRGAWKMDRALFERTYGVGA